MRIVTHIRRVSSKKSEFTITHLDKILTFQDSSGNKATETQKYTVTANINGLTNFGLKILNSDGTISYIHINGASPAQRQQENGKTKVAMQFDGQAKVSGTFETTLTLGHQHAFTKDQETLLHTIDNETKLLRMTVQPPAGRRTKFASLSRRYKDEETQEAPPNITEEGKIVANINNPPIGAEYCLRWDWPKAKLMDKIDNLFFYK